MSAQTYYLSKECFVCRMGCYWIILSTSRDRYLCVANGELMSIGSRLHGWQHPIRMSTEHSVPENEVNTLIQALTSNGIITSDPALGKPFAESSYPSPDSCIETPRPMGRTGISFLLAARFFLACGAVDWQLRRKVLPRTLARIERRRVRAESSAVSNNVVDAATPIAAFKVLRPLYPRPYLCLFESLALLEFLAHYNFFPRMVFGVVADPFQAHCWLQDGSTILDEDLERVSRYKPILSV